MDAAGTALGVNTAAVVVGTAYHSRRSWRSRTSIRCSRWPMKADYTARFDTHHRRSFPSDTRRKRSTHSEWRSNHSATPSRLGIYISHEGRARSKGCADYLRSYRTRMRLSGRSIRPRSHGRTWKRSPAGRKCGKPQKQIRARGKSFLRPVKKRRLRHLMAPSQHRWRLLRLRDVGPRETTGCARRWSVPSYG